jgi:hypothetical protein
MLRYVVNGECQRHLGRHGWILCGRQNGSFNTTRLPSASVGWWPSHSVGVDFHGSVVGDDAKLLNWVFKEDYFDYRLGAISRCCSTCRPRFENLPQHRTMKTLHQEHAVGVR